MQTNFTPKQLKSPRLAEIEKILRKCIHCGFCIATCPTYLILGDERDSPRGRIYLMKEMFERGRKATPEVQRHVDRCLSCLSCMTTCPSGVDYMHLVDHARVHIEETGKRGFKERMIRSMVAATVPYPDRLRMALRAARLARPLAGLFRRLGLKEVVAMLELAPGGLLRSADFSGPGTAATKTERRKRVILLAGCAQQVLRPEINDATIRLLARRGVDVEVAPGAGCCGALVHHMGREAAAIAMAKRNVDAWTRLMEKGDPVDAIIINTSGCGTTVKDYAHLLKGESKHAERAAKIAGMTRDVTEFLGSYDMGPPKRWSSLRVAYHSACSMQHGQRISEEPRKLLRNAGFTVMEIPEGHICCGSAGTYNILQPTLASELRERKIGNIRSVRPDLVATGNIGCITQLAFGMDIPIAHTVELLDWAYGGPVPRGLERLSAHVQDVPEAEQLRRHLTAGERTECRPVPRAGLETTAMRIGVPKEIKVHEYRVGMTPASVREATAHGHEVFVEHDVATRQGIADLDYERAGAKILGTAAEVFAKADLIVKVKEPQPGECAMLREGQTIFTYLHLAPDPDQAKALMASGVTAIAYETVTNARGGLPLLAPMSEVAGRMAIQAGAHCLEMEQGGRGMLLGGAAGVAPAKVVVLGGGVAGVNAARMAIGLEALVTVLDINVDRLYAIDQQFGAAVNTIFSTRQAIEDYVLEADLVVGAVLVPGAAAPRLLTRQHIKDMRRGSVIVDISIDQGGTSETSRPTTHAAPTYVVDEVVHYCVTNMPGAVARTSTFALNNATLPFILALAGKGVETALTDDPHLLNGLNVHKGHIVHPAVAAALGVKLGDAKRLVKG